MFALGRNQIGPFLKDIRLVEKRVDIPGGSGILAFILVLLLQGRYVLKIPSKLKHDSKKKEESTQ